MLYLKLTMNDAYINQSVIEEEQNIWRLDEWSSRIEV